MTLPRIAAAALASLVGLSACANGAGLTTKAGVGPDPTLPAPRQSLLPTVNIARAVGWEDGEAPSPADGLQVSAFATGLDHPRWLLVLPNGDVLVAETNKQQKPAAGPREFVQKRIMAVAGAEVPSADRISLLRDADGDGVAEMQVPLLTGLTSPFGMALVGDHLYVANTDALVRFPFAPGEPNITAPAERVAALPAGDPNRHWTKGLVASADGRTLYVSVGSNSDHAEGGIEAEAGRAAIWAIEAATGEARVFASGLRNPVGMDWEPATGALWTAVNERDELGDDLVPDYMTSVREGGFDSRVTPQRPELVATALKPDYALGAHTASLGLAFAAGAALGPQFAQGAFVGQHGSWNRKPRSGYKVIFVPFADGAPAGGPVDVLTGFLGEDGRARGRPVGVAIDGTGALLVADDVGNVIWRVTAER